MHTWYSTKNEDGVDLGRRRLVLDMATDQHFRPDEMPLPVYLGRPWKTVETIGRILL
jgi:hypothetical protein